MNTETLQDLIRATGSIVERLGACNERIGIMCSQGRPPRMSLPVEPSDDDVYITTTISDAIAELRRLDALVNSPLTADFLEATRAEVAHQVERWGTVHDRAKDPQDWFWLVGYLAGKALRAHIDGDEEKALHHTISSAAVLANWHAAIKLGSSTFTPGASDLQQFIETTFGDAVPASA